jgi:NAD(P)-dependent dehydrogenase (short-subunit alcohol dehydrogenase family)
MTQNILLLGANGGVGRAVAQALLSREFTVLATVSRPEIVSVLQREVPGCRRVVPLDLSNADLLAPALGRLIDDLPRLDGVVVCAAVSPFAPAEMTALEVFRTTMEINCVSHLAIYQAALPALRLSKGRLVFTGSLSGRVATPMMGAYVASKFALEGLADVMRQEASAWEVEVILLQPGTIDTPILRRSRDALAATVARLEDPERGLYGRLYRQMLYRVNAALEAGGIMPAATVAAVVVEALVCPNPQARYRVGADAEFLIEASRTKSDREIDALVLDIYRSAPVDADSADG